MTVLRPPGLLPAPFAAGAGALEELDRLEWRPGDQGTPGRLLEDLLQAHGLAEAGRGPADVAVVLLLGAAGCASLDGLAQGRPSPSPGVPELVAIAVRPGRDREPRPGDGGLGGPWRRSWTDGEHAAAVERVRDAIARGEVYQANVVGHRSAACTGDPAALAARVAQVGGGRAAYRGVVTGEGWAVGSASPEQLVRLEGRRVTTVPIKGTSHDPDALRTSLKDRAEHVMIVDLERNDLARVAVTGSVRVEALYEVAPWSALHHASSTVAAELADGVGVLDLLRALAPGGSVTGAPKRAACALLGGLEPVGRGPSMGAFGVVHGDGLDLGLTIRTVAVADGQVHVWAGGGITWGSDAQDEVAEAEAKAAPVLAALAAGASTSTS